MSLILAPSHEWQSRRTKTSQRMASFDLIRHHRANGSVFFYTPST
jgi:hypothetical protein